MRRQHSSAKICYRCLKDSILRHIPTFWLCEPTSVPRLPNSGQYDKAIAAFQVALARTPGDTAVRINLAQVFIKMQQWSDAAAQLEIINPIKADNIVASKLLLNCYLQSGSNQKLLAAARTVSRVHPGDVDLMHVTGIALLRNGIPEQGAESLEKAGTLGRRPDALTLAGVTRLKLGQTAAQARQDLDRAVAMNPGTPGALTMAGLARDKSGDEDGAKDLFQKALAVNSDDFDASLNLGAVLYREKNISAARKSVAKCTPNSADFGNGTVCYGANQGRRWRADRRNCRPGTDRESDSQLGRTQNQTRVTLFSSAAERGRSETAGDC